MIVALGGMDDLGMRDCMVRYLGRIEPQVLGTEDIEGKGFIGCGRVLQAGHCQECELGMSQNIQKVRMLFLAIDHT